MASRAAIPDAAPESTSRSKEFRDEEQTLIGKPITGFVSAPFTAMHPDLSINLDLIPAYADHLKSTGVAGVFVNGTTGEGYSLSREERMAAAEAWIRTKTDNFLVMIHVGAESSVDACALAAHASTIGADAIGSMSPAFFRPDIDGLVKTCAAIASAAADLPFYYYHLPSMTGFSTPVVDFLERASSAIPNLRGVKYTHYDLVDFRLCTAVDGGRYDILFGRDEVLLSALVLGSKGMVGSTYNYAMPLFGNILKGFEAGDLIEAAEAQERAMRLVRILERHGGGVVVGKALMGEWGLAMGPSRIANSPLNHRQIAEIASESRALGVFG